jgi:hypothetical protein
MKDMSVSLVIMMTPELKEAVTRAAKSDSWRKISASEFARQAIIEKLKRDVHVYPVRSLLKTEDSQ